MNNAACGRRLARPVRLAMAAELGEDLDGAWWPYTASLASELPGLVDALRRRVGDVIDISVNWSSLAGSPDLDAFIPRTAKPMPGLEIRRHQRVMVVTGSNACVNLMVVPCRTSAALAIMVLRQAAALPITTAELDTETFRTADTIVRAARVESVLQRYRTIAASPSPIEPREVLSESGVPSPIGGPPQ